MTHNKLITETELNLIFQYQELYDLSLQKREVFDFILQETLIDILGDILK